MVTMSQDLLLILLAVLLSWEFNRFLKSQSFHIHHRDLAQSARFTCSKEQVGSGKTGVDYREPAWRRAMNQNGRPGGRPF